MSDVLLVSHEGGICTLTLNRPDKLNALNAELIGALDQALDALAAKKDLRCVILTGAGEKAFAAGADIVAMSTMKPAEAKAFADLGHRVGAKLEGLHAPVIAAVNGFALGGGCELALACDFIYASDRAKFGQPEVNLGVIPGFGGTQRLTRRVGPARARELCYTGDIIAADEALRIGLANKVFPGAELLDKAKEAAQKIAEKGPLAIAQCKRVIERGADLPLASANELEAQAFSALFGSSDQKEGMAAFVAKRKAEFTGS
ncbi:MAG: enoyl-CoA hydratase-related protein [Polyangiaceae bacterium]